MNTFLDTKLSPEQKQARTARLLLWGKHFIFIFPLTIAGLFLGKYLYEYFYADQTLSGSSPLYMLIWLMVFLTVFFLGVLSIENKKGLILLVFLPGIATITVFILSGTSANLIIGSLLFLGMLLVAMFAGRWEMRTALKIRFARTGSSVIGKTMLAFSLLVGFVFFNAFSEKPLGEENILLPKSVFSEITPTASKALSPVLGDIDMSLTLRDAATKAVDAAIDESSDRSIRYATPEILRKQLIDQSVIEFQRRIESTLGVMINPDEKISDAVYEGLLHKFNTLGDSARTITLAILSLVVVLVLQTSSIILRLVIIPLSFIVYEILLMMNFIRIDFQKRDKEIITLKR